MSRRTAKVEELLREEISKLIQAKLTENFGIITVTRTSVAPDLRTAQIFITAVRTDREKEILVALKNASAEFQKVIGKKIVMRNTPKLTFAYDRARTEIDRIEELLGEINNGA